MKRLFDLIVSLGVLALAAPVILVALLAVWLYDRHSPIYHATRVGIGNRDFRMAKIRSMRVDAERMGGTSTSARDPRITPVGHLIRRFKLDELSQFWNVLKGDMHIVGPRPNTRRGGVDEYNAAEMRLLDVRPGITDLSSIVFSDEGDILAGAADPDARYNTLIRPWKSRLGLLYIANQSVALDARIVWLTALALVSKRRARDGVARIVERLGGSPALVATCRRQADLVAVPPPGADGAAATV